jgi:dTMP kinase
MSGRGKFIIFEGIDGSGKSTRSQIAVEYLKEQNIDVLFLSEPAKGFLGSAIKQILIYPEEELSLLAQILLFSANRANCYHQVIGPALDLGTWVVMDRSWLSTVAYQGYGIGKEDKRLLANIELITKIVTEEINFDLCILCDINPQVALQRVSKRGDKKDFYENQDDSVLERIRRGYLECIKKYPELNFVVLDTEKNIDGNELVMKKEIEEILLKVM